MESMNEKFEFEAFEPDASVKKLSGRILSELIGLAPSDATSLAKLVKTATGFEASLKLCSMAGTFAAKVAGHNPIEAVEALSERIGEQIAKWREIRFSTQKRLEA